MIVGWRAAEAHAVKLLEGSAPQEGLTPGYALGLVSGSGKHPSRSSAMVLLLLLALSLGLILDMDRPRRGTIRVSQQPLMDLRASMK